MKRLGKVDAPSARHLVSDKLMASQWPSLLAFLTDTEYDPADGGGKRETGVFSVWATVGGFNAKLTDKDSGHVCYVAAASWSLLMAALDAACADPGGGWKPDQAGSTRRRK